MATRLQVKQLGFVTDIRETRLQHLVDEAIVALEGAEAQLESAAQMVVKRKHDAEGAATDFARTPESEMIRIWRDVCVQRLSTAETDYEMAQIERDEAQMQLIKARRDLMRIKERGNKIADLGKVLHRDEMRQKEARVDDENPGGRANILMLEGSE
jgi:uncharacterized protein (DUF3084 family)